MSYAILNDTAPAEPKSSKYPTIVMVLLGAAALYYVSRDESEKAREERLRRGGRYQ